MRFDLPVRPGLRILVTSRPRTWEKEFHNKMIYIECLTQEELNAACKSPGKPPARGGS
jgi:hypothetical protein